MAERSTNNSEYWERRFQAIESENHQKAKLTAADTVEAYKEACRNCQKEIEAWYGRFAQNNGITIAEARTMLSKQELAELQWDAEQYIKALEDNEISGKWVKELENASARYHISKYEGLQIRLRQQIEAAAAVEQGNLMHHLTDVYGETMYKTAYEMQSGLNTGFEIAKVNEKQINAVLNRPWAADGKAFSDRIWQRKEELKQKLDNEITRNIMLGKGVKDSTISIAREFGVTENRAAALVYTETAYVASEAQKAQFKELGVEQFEIVATLDNRTSEICQDMDGKHMPMSDFKSGVTAPPFHPNCRSVTVPYLDDEFREIFGEGERAARDENGKTVSVPEDMTYPEWKKVFVDKSQTMDEWTAAKEAAKAAASVEVPKTIAFKPAESIEAAEEYAKKFISDGYSPTFKNQAVYKGISLEHANEINKTLEELYAEYDLPPLSGIKVISPTSAQGKKVFKDGADAVAAYNPTEKGLFINKDVLKNAKTLEAYNKKAREAYDYVLDNIDSLKGSQRELAETYKKAGRSLVGDGSVKSHITHEIGHHVQWDVLSTDANNSMGKNMAKYAPQISGYANASKGEYIAESFAAYVRGERDILDPDFVQYLDKNVVKSVAKSAESGIIKAGQKIKIDLNFFGKKEEYENQTTNQLLSGIKKETEQIRIHKDKISNPEKYIEGYADKDARYKLGIVRHWKLEIANFEKQIQMRKDVLMQRGDIDES